MSTYLTIEGRKFDKFCVIQHAHPDCGFCALITTVLNSVRIALQHNWFPIVNLDKHVSDYFYDSMHGENIWEYYFEPVMGLSYKAFTTLVEREQIVPSLIHAFNNRNRVDQILQPKDPGFISHFWVGDPPRNPAEWMTRKRHLGREYVAKYVRVKPHIWSLVDEFYGQNLDQYHTYGVHIRGTDFGYAEPTKPETYFKAIHESIRKDQHSDIRIFLATDQEQFVDLFRKEFGNIVVTYSSIRSTSEMAPFQFNHISPYKKGEDVLVDMLLLSRCNFLFKCASAVGEYAMWFNPSLKCHDFALESHWDPSHFAPASLKLNVNDIFFFNLSQILIRF